MAAGTPRGRGRQKPPGRFGGCAALRFDTQLRSNRALHPTREPREKGSAAVPSSPPLPIGLVSEDLT